MNNWIFSHSNPKLRPNLSISTPMLLATEAFFRQTGNEEDYCAQIDSCIEIEPEAFASSPRDIIHRYKSQRYEYKFGIASGISRGNYIRHTTYAIGGGSGALVVDWVYTAWHALLATAVDVKRPGKKNI